MEFSFSTTTLGNASKTISLKELENWVAPDRAKMARKAYAEGDESLYKKLKCNVGKDRDKSIPYGMCPAIMAHTSFIGESRNSAGCLDAANHVLVFDYDELKHCEDSYEVRHKLASDLLQKLLDDGAAFGTLSASGVGFWVAYRYPEEPRIEDVRDFKRYYDSMMELVSTKYQLVFDPSCSNINRWRFLGIEPVKLGTGTFILPAPAMKERKQTKAQCSITRHSQNLDLVSWLKETNQIIGDVKPDGSYNLVCPWEDEHSCSTGESECGWSPTEGFHCFHGSCAHRTFKDFLQYQIGRGFAHGEEIDDLTYRLVSSKIAAEDIKAAIICQFHVEDKEADGIIAWAERKKIRLDSIEAGETPNAAQLVKDYFAGWTYDKTTERFYRPGTKPHAGVIATQEGYDEDYTVAMCYRNFPAGLVPMPLITAEVSTVKQLSGFDGVVVRCEQLAKAWNGHDYITDFAVRHFDNDPYLVKRWYKWLVGGAAMWLHPGTKHDSIFVITGSGALQKTLFAERLAYLTSGTTPCDLDISDRQDKDSDILRSQATIAVYEEIFGGSMTRREGENAKRQATRRQITTRAAYARGAKTYYFRALQLASSNHPDALPSTDAEKRRYYIASISQTLAEPAAFLAQMLGQAISCAQAYFATPDGQQYRKNGYADVLPPWMETHDELMETIARNSGFEASDALNLAIMGALQSLPAEGIYGKPLSWVNYILTGDPTGLYTNVTMEPYAPFDSSYSSSNKSGSVTAESLLRRLKERVDCRKLRRALPSSNTRQYVITSEQLVAAFPCEN